MIYAEAIQFLYGLRWFGAKFGLENTRQLAASAGNPQNQLRFIHVAGTNGKGSTCAMLESVYRTARLRVGLFTSPHLVSFRERMQVNRQLISEPDVVRLVEELRGLCSAGFQPAGSASILARSPETGGTDAAPTRMQDACATSQPTFFEFITIMALRYFAEQRCDLVIWETGLGGRLDATNIVTPLASVITNIGYDHQQWLGDTLAKIAVEKAGIIKPGVPVLTATRQPEALAVINQVAQEHQAPLTRVHASNLTPHAALWGEHQKLNAALAVATVGVLQSRIPVSEAVVRRGLEKVHWPGRLQLVTRPSGQRVLLDGAHNPAGAEVLHAALCGAPSTAAAHSDPDLQHAEPAPGTPLTLILGILADKDCRAMCEILAPLATRLLLVPVGSERTARPEDLLPFCRAANPTAFAGVCGSLPQALAQAERDPFVVIAGSLYLMGEAMELLGLSPVPTADEKALNNWQPTSQAAKSF